MPRLLLPLATFALVAALGCGRDEASDTGGVVDTAPGVTSAPAPDMPDPTTGAGDFAFEQRQEFAQSIRQQMTDIDQQIAELADQAKSRGGAVSDRALANIRAARQAVNRNLQRVDAATADNWEQIRTGVSEAVDNLTEAIEAAQPK
ncbi:MAG TPA: hypothetical protein VHH32_07285 [Gemmatimonadales bacterium]|nr:hypothetical protein [Gemmatimonadales bacterium]